MPPPKIPPPQFSLTGRYLLDVSTRWDKTTPNYFHDLENIQPECKLEGMSSGNISRFDSIEWALFRGYQKCLYCFNEVS